MAAHNVLGTHIEIDWSAIRVICIAPGFKKYDLHADQQMGVNIELWRYRLFANKSLLLEEVQGSASASKKSDSKKPTATGAYAPHGEPKPEYTWDNRMQVGSDRTCELAAVLREYCLGLSDTVEEAVKKHYIAYKTTKKFCCIEMQKKQVLLSLRVDPESIQPLPLFARDMRNIGHFGTGDLEISIKSEGDIEEAKLYIDMAFNSVGGS